MAAPTPDTPIQTFRSTLARIVPWWLQGPIAGAILWAIGLHFDALAEMLVQAVRRRFPGYDNTADGLDVIGRERRIPRGRLEPDATYALRLQRWLDDHRRRGGPYALLRQLYAHNLSSPVAASLLYLSGTQYTLGFDGSITENTDPAFAPDADPHRGRWWLFYYLPTAIATDGLWSDAGVYDDGGVWDSSLSADEVRDYQLVPGSWGNGHSTGTVVLLQPGAVPADYTTAGDFIRMQV